METIEALLKRRSIRSFEKDYKVPQEILETIVGAALNSPTGLDIQGLDLVIINNREEINKVTELAMKTWPQEWQDKFMARKTRHNIDNVVTGDASTLFLLVKNENATGDLIKFDAGIMAMAIMASAVNFGLGTCCLGCLATGKLYDVEKEIKRPEGSIVIGVTLGKPRTDVPLHEKKIKCKAQYIE